VSHASAAVTESLTLTDAMPAIIIADSERFASEISPPASRPLSCQRSHSSCAQAETSLTEAPAGSGFEVPIDKVGQTIDTSSSLGACTLKSAFSTSADSNIPWAYSP